MFLLLASLYTFVLLRNSQKYTNTLFALLFVSYISDKMSIFFPYFSLLCVNVISVSVAAFSNGFIDTKKIIALGGFNLITAVKAIN